jgi:tRNA A37 N6-isopentenylltransferase MiaA
MKRDLMLLCVGGAIVSLQAVWTGAARGPEKDQQHRQNRQTLGSAVPAHQNHPRPRFFDKEVATRIPHTVSSNQSLGDGTLG